MGARASVTAQKLPMASSRSCTSRSRQNADQPLRRLVGAARDQPPPDQRGAHGAARRPAERHQPEPLAVLGIEQAQQHAGGEGGMAASPLTGDGDFGNGGDPDCMGPRARRWQWCVTPNVAARAYHRFSCRGSPE